MGDAFSNAVKARREAEAYLQERGWTLQTLPNVRLSFWKDPDTDNTHYFDDAWDIQYARDRAKHMAKCKGCDVCRKCGKCDACQIEAMGCGCDGAYDDGCFLCHPNKHTRPLCP